MRRNVTLDFCFCPVAMRPVARVTDLRSVKATPDDRRWAKRYLRNHPNSGTSLPACLPACKLPCLPHCSGARLPVCPGVHAIARNLACLCPFATKTTPLRATSEPPANACFPQCNLTGSSTLEMPPTLAVFTRSPRVPTGFSRSRGTLAHRIESVRSHLPTLAAGPGARASRLTPVDTAGRRDSWGVATPTKST